MHHTFIFTGQSGCGKGTQAKLISNLLEEKFGKDSLFKLETGDHFRTFIKKDLYASEISRKLYDAGHLQPEFLAIWMWSDFFISNLKPDQHMVMDGCPRKFHEAIVLDSAMKFFGREKPCVVYLKVSDGWAAKHLMTRHRVDDSSELVKSRLAWFHTDVEPAIEWYRTNKDYNFIEVDGERPIEEVHKELMSKISHTF